MRELDYSPKLNDVNHYTVQVRDKCPMQMQNAHTILANTRQCVHVRVKWSVYLFVIFGHKISQRLVSKKSGMKHSWANCRCASVFASLCEIDASELVLMSLAIVCCVRNYQDGNFFEMVNVN